MMLSERIKNAQAVAISGKKKPASGGSDQRKIGGRFESDPRRNGVYSCTK